MDLSLHGLGHELQPQAADTPMFTNVFVRSGSTLNLKNGKWPDKTMFVSRSAIGNQRFDQQGGAFPKRFDGYGRRSER